MKMWAIAPLLLFVSCAGIIQKQESLESRTAYIAPRAGFEKIKVVLLPFQNSARMGEFDIIPDGDYSSKVIRRTQNTITSDTLVPLTLGDAPPQEPEGILPGDLYREIAETELFQSGRFEVIPYYKFAEERAKIDPEKKDPTSVLKTAQSMGIQLLISGDCTDFEIKQSRSFWKIPLWAIILAASFAIDDRNLRAVIWEAMIRMLFVVPLNSPFWDEGIGWEDTDLDVLVSLNMRASGPSGSIRFSDESAVKRTESVRNLDLLVWKESRKVRIQKASAGRQIRFATSDLVRKISREADQGLR